ncbi:MAG: metalloregulator ArsR/SmtB family transcription factor [Promethearchaeia archaeon]
MDLKPLKIKTLKALSDETRLEIISLLRHGEELCGCELEKVIDKSQSTISRHLKKLEEADLVERRREGVKVLYRIKDPKIYKLLAVLNNLIKRNNKFKKIVELQKEIK